MHLHIYNPLLQPLPSPPLSPNNLTSIRKPLGQSQCIRLFPPINLPVPDLCVAPSLRSNLKLLRRYLRGGEEERCWDKSCVEHWQGALVSVDGVVR